MKTALFKGRFLYLRLLLSKSGIAVISWKEITGFQLEQDAASLSDFTDASRE